MAGSGGASGDAKWDRLTPPCRPRPPATSTCPYSLNLMSFCQNFMHSHHSASTSGTRLFIKQISVLVNCFTLILVGMLMV